MLKYLIILIILAILFIFGCVQEQSIKESDQENIEFEFSKESSSEMCSSDKTETSWIDSTTLEIKKCVMHGGGDRIDWGGYRIYENKIELLYKYTPCEEAGGCPSIGYYPTLTYLFKNIEKKDYEITLERTF